MKVQEGIWRNLAGLGFLAAVPLIAPALAQPVAPAPEAPTGRTAKSAATTGKDMVAAANPLAAQAGREILAAGGSAVDAAIAVQLVLNLVEPQSSGIGGGAFLVFWDGATMTTLDGREKAPAAAKPRTVPRPPGASSAKAGKLARFGTISVSLVCATWRRNAVFCAAGSDVVGSGTPKNPRTSSCVPVLM